MFKWASRFEGFGQSFDFDSCWLIREQLLILCWLYSYSQWRICGNEMWAYSYFGRHKGVIPDRAVISSVAVKWRSTSAQLKADRARCVQGAGTCVIAGSGRVSGWLQAPHSCTGAGRSDVANAPPVAAPVRIQTLQPMSTYLHQMLRAAAMLTVVLNKIKGPI
jgi:hypothetical protein